MKTAEAIQIKTSMGIEVFENISYEVDDNILIVHRGENLKKLKVVTRYPLNTVISYTTTGEQ